ITENVNLIRSIPQQHLTQVETLVMQSVGRGRDLKTLTDELEKRYGITRRRAALIARDQNNKATSVMQSARQRSVGIT
ncbi:phage head morphogenesis protein, partial [Salmonella enterica subsp. enterica serovar Typhimurium]